MSFSLKVNMSSKRVQVKTITYFFQAAQLYSKFVQKDPSTNVKVSSSSRQVNNVIDRNIRDTRDWEKGFHFPNWVLLFRLKESDAKGNCSYLSRSPQTKYPITRMSKRKKKKQDRDDFLEETRKKIGDNVATLHFLFLFPFQFD